MTEYGLKISQGRANMYAIGHMIRYECTGNYISIGNLIARCVYPGIWSRFNGSCQKIRQVP